MYCNTERDASPLLSKAQTIYTFNSLQASSQIPRVTLEPFRERITAKFSAVGDGTSYEH